MKLSVTDDDEDDEDEEDDEDDEEDEEASVSVNLKSSWLASIHAFCVLNEPLGQLW